MKMKRIHIFLILVVAAFASCEDDYLERFPKDELSAGSFWKQEQDAEQFMIALYQNLPMFLIDDEINSDNALHGIKWAEGDVAKGIYDPLDGTFSGHWSGNYSGLRKCNILLENIDNIETFETYSKDEIIAQTKFFRAYLHFELCKVFGDVPLIDKSLVLEETYELTRTPVAQVIDFILKDLSDAAADLPTTWSGGDYGKITKGAALAMKARVQLFYSKWGDAAATAKQVMDLNVYDLYDKENTGKYAELFYASEPGDERKAEMVLETQRKPDDYENWYNTWSAPPGFGWGGINPTQSFVDEFECTDGKTIAESDLYDDSKPFENRDPRLEVNVLHHGEVYKGVDINTRPVQEDYPRGIATHRDATSTGYYQQKFLNPNEEINGADGWNSSHDWPVIRYAEVLLTYAEAKNEAGGPDADVYAAVNSVRERVGMPALPEGLSKDEMRTRIRREWRVEFGMEGKRWLDIRRWDIGNDVLNGQFYGMKYDPTTKTAFIGTNVAAGVPRQYKAHNRLWPVPQNQIDLNEKLTQNTGY
ncbi:RagB/SusD family nutrient uptake outer membrane protein [Puteibacter caeruleilacunae]|nr:RagB/SusD family nutrient uptake outer membrane protein [Puteibacter caeruleilacunae]